MENILKKKRIRIVALILIAAAAVTAVFFAIDFERADYKNVLGETIEEAQTLLLTAETGYEKGQYLPETVVAFSESIDTAKRIYEDSSSVYEQQKSAYEILKEDIRIFRQAANKKDLTQKEKAQKQEKSEKLKQPKTEADNSKSSEIKKHSSGEKSEPANKEKKITVTIQIRCDNLSNDMSKLTDESKAPWIPANGVVLDKTEYKCTKGTTVYDVLYAVCRNANIHIESSYTPVYGSYYIEGINHLYEFDAGSESGWMYKVNGTYPDYGCSSYKLQDGDNIVWGYTCNLGKDLGDGY